MNNFGRFSPKRKSSLIIHYSLALRLHYSLFIYSINIASAKLMLYKTNLLVSRNFARQGKASAKPDGVVTYVEGDKSKL